MTSFTVLSPTQKYAAGGVLALALRQAQIHQTRPFPIDEVVDEGEDDAVDLSHFWTHVSQGLLRPVLRHLGVEPKAWHGIEETVVVSSAKHHIQGFLKILSEEAPESSSESKDQELGLMKSVDAMVKSMEVNPSDEENVNKNFEYERECRDKISAGNDQSASENLETSVLTNAKVSQDALEVLNGPATRFSRKSMLEGIEFSYQRKVSVLFELLSACLAGEATGVEKKGSRVRKGYDARHRVALRFLATWLGVDWIKMEAMEVIVATAAVAVKEGGSKTKDADQTESTWSSWKRGGIIGAAALTGGTLLAITGGLAAPAIAAGFGALAPTLGTLVPVIGASGFAAVASAAGSVAGSVAVAASFGAAGAGLTGVKMARRMGNVEEFEFISIGENHNKGRLAVGIFISGLVFENEDFRKPWEGQDDNSEKYALQWESENLIAVSTAIQDWITSRITLELMKQGAMVTVLSSLLTALAWPATILAATDFIDSKWSIAIDRSDKAGKLLAEVLIKGLQGNRPVTLCGFSLGARVIFKCLQHLAEEGNNEGIVERVILLGAPISLKDEDWASARKVVAGRFLNVYSRNDWMLGVAFRASLLSKGLAGIQPVEISDIENVDVTDVIDGHSSYLWATKRLLELLQLDAAYPLFPSPPSRTP
ncbi:hypothetical protein H6P81_018778 [Aristolochia fimbriata]|uniref:Transmembrane and coiled-coil domain-containing protein 4 n=1 Tax=Aristolochia fimbriata TaxID=158543 RepID=A0AAV7E289_ARIFI|nr:hypothetical protein H6P81_018778 [Aristolochia fimbriata]